jgi:hypothetical protein
LKEETMIVLGRMACGTGILIASMVTGVNGFYQLLSAVLLGVPLERISIAKKKEETPS